MDKINRKGKSQTRVLLITDRAVYNVTPDTTTCKRRIDLRHITSIIVSTTSDQFVIKVPTEYDYLYSSPGKKTVADIIKDAKFSMASGDVSVEFTAEPQLASRCLTRLQAAAASGTGVAGPQGGRASGSGASELSSTSAGKSTSGAAAASSGTAGIVAVIPAAGADLGTIREEDEADSDEDETGAAASSSSAVAAEDVTEGWSKPETTVRLSDFDLLKVIGRGSFGKVMLVRLRGHTEVLAMKILSKAMIIKRNQLDHTKAERAVLESIDHPFLVRLRYAFQTPTKLYMVMPFLRGGELFFHLRKAKRFGEETAKFFAAEIALGLGHLHSKGIIYRDLKPENILLDAQGHIKLTDFGLAKSLTRPGEKTETFCGTPEYLAPEVVCSEPHDKEVDWWALGVLTYEMMHGLPPFYSSNVQVMYDKIEASPVAFPAHFSAEAVDFITRILDKDPASRLGAGTRDVEDIKAHPFFASIDFDKLEARAIPSPFKPIVRGTSDTSNFDKEFTSEPVVDSVVPDSGFSMSAGGKFEGFTFVDSGAMASST